MCVWSQVYETLKTLKVHVSLKFQCNNYIITNRLYKNLLSLKVQIYSDLLDPGCFGWTGLLFGGEYGSDPESGGLSGNWLKNNHN